MVITSAPQTTPALSSPVGHLLRPTLSCAVEDSINRALGELRRNGGGILPIHSDGKLRGIVTEAILARVLAEGIDPMLSCADVMARAKTISNYASGAEALRLFSDEQVACLIVVDDNELILGVLSPSDLFPRRRHLARPEPVGGMATPFGVYLTSGALSGGVPVWAVMATGATMFCMLAVGSVLSNLAQIGMDKLAVPQSISSNIVIPLPFILFGLFMRLAPLSGIHGAEHMVVHAMERGEDLTPEIVARMPRVHPRCGTNLAVAVSLFTGIAFSEWTSDPEVRVLVAAVITLFCWKPLGSFAQKYITTKKPNEKQLRSGIKAANDIIERYATARVTTASIPKRIWNSGLIQVIAGSTLAYSAIRLILFVCHVNVPGLE